MINIIDVGLGNIRSIEHWLNRSNLFYKRVSSVEDFTDDAKEIAMAIYPLTI